MKIDLVATEDWDRADDAVAALWGVEPGQQVRVHPGLAAATFEIALVLGQTYSHRRALAVVKGNSPAFDHVLPWFLKEAYQVQSTSWKALPSESEIKAWVDGLKKETAFVLLAEDHPVTGERRDVDAVDRLLNEKKIFVLRVSHAAYAFHRDPPRPMTTRICSIDPSLAVSVSGARMKMPPAFSNRLPWRAEDARARVETAFKSAEDRAAVEAFEQTFASQRLLADGTLRVFDRAVLGFTDVSGESLLGEISARIGEPPAIAPFMDTTNLCRWDSTRLLKGWWEDAPSDEILRGLVTFSPSILRRKDFAKHLAAAYDELRSSQTW